MIIQIGICDNDKCTCRDLENNIYSFLKQNGLGANVYVWNSGKCICEDLLKIEKLDVLFLNIELDEIDGIAVGRYIRKTIMDNSVQIIFISSKANCQMELFKIHPYDFLIKPITYRMLENVMMDILKLNEYDKQCYVYMYNRVQYKVAYSDIIYMQSSGKHIELHLYDKSIRYFVGKLDNEIQKVTSEFGRASKSYIVNFKYIIECRHSYIRMSNGEQINISRKYKESFICKFLEYNLNLGTNNY